LPSQFLNFGFGLFIVNMSWITESTTDNVTTPSFKRAFRAMRSRRARSVVLSAPDPTSPDGVSSKRKSQSRGADELATSSRQYRHPEERPAADDCSDLADRHPEGIQDPVEKRAAKHLRDRLRIFNAPQNQAEQPVDGDDPKTAESVGKRGNRHLPQVEEAKIGRAHV
jgi:hypothetical protein